MNAAPAPKGRRIVSVSLPSFPIERWLRQTARSGCIPPAEVPLALWVEGGHGPIIHAMTPAAAQAGIKAGARLADMRAICPQLRAEPADPQGDAAALDRLALWARRFCPWTVADRSAPDAGLGSGAGLVLDTTGADHLWGGEAAMLAAIEGDLAVRGLQARAAVAPTWGAAWGLARFGPVRAVAHDLDPLAPLPVAALRLSPDMVLGLRRLGLRRVADLAAIPRLSLTRRFGRMPAADNPLIRLDQASGRLPEPLDPPEPPPAFRALARLPEAVLEPAQNLPALCTALCADLAAAHQGARLLRLSVWRVDGSLRWIDAGTASATRDPAHVAFLFRERLERIDPGYGFDLIELAAPQVEPMSPDQRELTGEVHETLDLAQLFDRLEARFGPGRVTQPSITPEADLAVQRGTAADLPPANPAPAGAQRKRRQPQAGRAPARSPDTQLPRTAVPAPTAAGNPGRAAAGNPARAAAAVMQLATSTAPPLADVPTLVPAPAGAVAPPPAGAAALPPAPTTILRLASTSAPAPTEHLASASGPVPAAATVMRLAASTVPRPAGTAAPPLAGNPASPPAHAVTLSLASIPGPAAAGRLGSCAGAAPALRPVRLLDPACEVRVLYAVPEGPPAQFIWRGRTCRVGRWAGPERIAPAWWSARPGTRLRDYYRVEDTDGLRLWLYREGLAGDGRGGLPRWFVHGVFD